MVFRMSTKKILLGSLMIALYGSLYLAFKQGIEPKMPLIWTRADILEGEILETKKSLNSNTTDRKVAKGQKGWQWVIHSVSILNTDKFILFSTAVYNYQQKYKILNCTVSGREIPGRSIGVGMFECSKARNIHKEAVLSIKLSNNQVLPSRVKWKDGYPLKSPSNTTLSLCLVTMVKNEENTIVDWLDYHLRQGVELFLIYENNSTDKTRLMMAKYKEVVVVDWPWPKSQVAVFVHGALKVRGVCKWALFTDVDEFVFPGQVGEFSPTVGEMINNFPMGMGKQRHRFHPLDVDQVCFESKDMGPSGYIRCPNLTVSEAYTQFLRFSSSGKCAVRPTRIRPKTRIHRFSVLGKTVVLPRQFTHLVHYKFQCWEHYLTKYEKGRASSMVRDWDKRRVDKNKPKKMWLTELGQPDTLFRDYKRQVDGWPLPAHTPNRHRKRSNELPKQ